MKALFRWRVPNSLLMALTALVGLIAFSVTAHELGDGEVSRAARGPNPSASGSALSEAC
jgi:hypothetical protein